jgi:PTS system galactitol-specific IIC component
MNVIFVNDATGYGESATLITVIMLMPLVLVTAFILPGNRVLPLLNLVFIFFPLFQGITS